MSNKGGIRRVLENSPIGFKIEPNCRLYGPLKSGYFVYGRVGCRLAPGWPFDY
jgi:hypothetical protein